MPLETIKSWYFWFRRKLTFYKKLIGVYLFGDNSFTMYVYMNNFLLLQLFDLLKFQNAKFYKQGNFQKFFITLTDHKISMIDAIRLQISGCTSHIDTN